MLLPWGPAWHAWKLKDFLIKKDKAQYFAKDNKTHKHVAVVGYDAVFSGKPSWTTHEVKDDGEVNSQYVCGRHGSARTPVPS